MQVGLLQFHFKTVIRDLIIPADAHQSNAVPDESFPSFHPDFYRSPAVFFSLPTNAKPSPAQPPEVSELIR
jgi:hypothetical protein